MRNALLYYLELALILIINPDLSVFAQDTFWERMSGPFGGHISQMAIDTNGYIFAITYYGGLYRSMNNGDSWTEKLAGNPADNTLYHSITVTKLGNILTCTQGYISRSSDNGDSWTKIHFTHPYNFFSEMVVNSKGHIFGGGLLGMFRSTDEGDTWIEINTGLDMSYKLVRCVAIDDSGHIYVGFEDRGIYRTTDDGEHWISVNDTLDQLRSLVVTKSGYILAATYADGLFRSMDKGQSWTQVYSNYPFPFALSINSAGQVFLGTLNEGILRSDDEGTTWQIVNQGLTNTEIHCFAVNKSDHIFAGTGGGGVYRSTTHGDEWVEINSGLDNVIVQCLETNSNSFLFAGTYGNGLYRSTDHGSSWIKISNGIREPYIWALATNINDVIFASTPGANYYSTNEGEDWIPMPYTPQFWTYATSNDGDVYAGGYGVFRSSNNGLNWEMVLPDSVCCFTLATNYSGYIFAGDEKGIYRSLDKGENWEHYTVDPANPFVSSIGIGLNGHLFATVHDDGWINCNLFRSSDNGEHWVEASNGLEGRCRQAVSFASNSLGHVFIATSCDGVYRSTTDGETWESFNDGLNEKSIVCVFIDNEGFLYATSFSGGGSVGGHVFKSKYSTISEIGVSNALPIIFRLNQNYPNPFNPSTIIEFALPKPEWVTLTVFNVLGQQVASLVSEKLNPGIHKYQWQANNLPSGIYYCRMKAGEYEQVRKMILIR